MRTTAHKANPPEISESNIFSEQLHDQPSSSGAKRAPHSDFALAAGRAGQQQIRKIHAGDQQNEPDGSEQYEQLGAHVTDQVFLHGNQPQSPSGGRRIVVRILQG
jgi:hypothetical protein